MRGRHCKAEWSRAEGPWVRQSRHALAVTLSVEMLVGLVDLYYQEARSSGLGSAIPKTDELANLAYRLHRIERLLPDRDCLKVSLERSSVIPLLHLERLRGVRWTYKEVVLPAFGNRIGGDAIGGELVDTRAH